MTEIHKSCCFIGHRNANLSAQELDVLKNIIENLILKENVKDFLFGSKSKFNEISHKIVTELKEKYTYIERKFYNLRSEYCVLESERLNLEKIMSTTLRKDVKLMGMEGEVSFSKKLNTTVNSYIVRNQAMIDNSDYCIFYYDENYLPIIKKKNQSNISGTKKAYEYALKKKKLIINVYNFKSTIV